MVSVVGDLAVCRDAVFVIKTNQNKTKQLVLQVQIIAFFSSSFLLTESRTLPRPPPPPASTILCSSASKRSSHAWQAVWKGNSNTVVALVYFNSFNSGREIVNMNAHLQSSCADHKSKTGVNSSE